MSDLRVARRCPVAEALADVWTALDRAERLMADQPPSPDHIAIGIALIAARYHVRQAEVAHASQAACRLCDGPHQ